MVSLVERQRTRPHRGTSEPRRKMNTNEISSNEVEVTARAKAFTGESIKAHKFLVRGNEVKVWDSIAGHYTSCHAMSAATLARIAKLAK